jgi:hypothetical protein
LIGRKRKRKRRKTSKRRSIQTKIWRRRNEPTSTRELQSERKYSWKKEKEF